MYKALNFMTCVIHVCCLESWCWYHSTGQMQCTHPTQPKQNACIIFNASSLLAVHALLWLRYMLCCMRCVKFYASTLWCVRASQSACIKFACIYLPSVLWRCWLGGRKGIWPVKNWVVGCWRSYLSGARCRLAYSPADATGTHCLLLQ